MEYEKELRVVENLFKEAKEFLNKDDIIQSSEKIYKVVEKGIKLLAEKYKISEYSIAITNNRWHTSLLRKASYSLSDILKQNIIKDAWKIAYHLHVWGFHEEKENAKAIYDSLEIIAEFIK